MLGAVESVRLKPSKHQRVYTDYLPNLSAPR
jgi:hypothetical protein